MTTARDPEQLLSAYLADGMEVLPDRVAESVLDEVHRTRQLTGLRRVRARRFGRSRGMTLFAAAAALLLLGGALAAGSGLLRQPTIVPPAPSLGPLAIASVSPSPRKLATASPSPTAVPITWTQASLQEDWPAPVRTEPAGRPLVVPLRKNADVTDPTGDTGLVSLPSADITSAVCSQIGVMWNFAAGFPDGVDPRQQWFAFGLVVDTDGDGVADWRYGEDNAPVGTPRFGDNGGEMPGDPAYERWWRTDLHTGRTEWNVGDGLFNVPGAFWGWHEGSSSGHAHWRFGSDVTNSPANNKSPGFEGELPKKQFYFWASMIQDGRVVATDYAPDAGWVTPQC